MSAMRTSAVGRQAIRNFEGLRLNAYPDAGGVWTIGYGTTRVDGAPVQPGMQITRERAEALLELDLLEFERAVNELVAVPLTQPQFDALVSFAYNVGSTALRNSTLLRKLNAGDTAGAADELLRWNQAGGQVLDGLSRRRAAERALFLSQPAGPLAPAGLSPPAEAPAPAAPASKPYVWTDPDVDRFPGSTGGRSDSSGQPADAQSPADESGPPPRIPPVPAPTATTPEVPSMNPFLVAAVPKLIEWAGEAGPALIRVFGRDGSKVSERNARALEIVVDAAKAATGKATVEEAVAGLAGDTAARAVYQRSVLDDLDRIMGIVARGVEIDDASADRAAARAKGEAWDMLPFLADRGFKLLAAAVGIQVLLLALGFWLKVPTEALMILLTLLVGTMTKLTDRWGQLYDYRVGSSAGSKASGDAVRAIAEQARR